MSMMFIARRYAQALSGGEQNGGRYSPRATQHHDAVINAEIRSQRVAVSLSRWYTISTYAARSEA